MRVDESIESEHFAATYQSLEIARLNETLREHGVESPSVRRAICEDYFFDHGQFVDSGWFSESQKRISPVIGFAERDQAGSITILHLPDPQVGPVYHEMAHGAAAWLFEDKQEDATEIKVGEWEAA